MTFKILAKKVCEKEALKEQVNIAQVSEILKVLRSLCVKDLDGVLSALGVTLKVSGVVAMKKKKA